MLADHGRWFKLLLIHKQPYDRPYYDAEYRCGAEQREDHPQRRKFLGVFGYALDLGFELVELCLSGHLCSSVADIKAALLRAYCADVHLPVSDIADGRVKTSVVLAPNTGVGQSLSSIGRV